MKKGIKLISIIITFLLIIVYPLFIYKINVYTGLNDYNWYFGSNNQIEYFTKAKSYFIVLISSIMLITLVLNIINNIKDKKSILLNNKNIYLVILLNVIVFVVSTICSINRVISFYGFYEQYENVFVLISYLIIFIFYYNYNNAFIGLLNSKILSHFVYIQAFILIILAFIQNKDVALTMYNPDYAATYLLMFIPLSVYIFTNTNNKILKLIRGILCILLALTLIKTNAFYPILLLIFEFIVTLIYIYLYRNSKIYSLIINRISKKQILTIFSIVIILFLSLYAFSSSRSNDLYNTPLGISEINTENDCVKVTLNDNILIFSDDNNTSSHELNYSPAVVNSERYGMLNGFFITCDYENMFFTNDIDNKYQFLTPYDKLLSINTAERLIFKNTNGINKGREYIWARTFPIIKKHLFFGVGPDAFTYAFPHNDYIQAYCVDYGYQLITKPHSFYLQIISQTGILSFILFIILVFVSFKSFYSKKQISNKLYFTVFLGVIVFLLSGLMNDSCIAVTPLFYVLLGVQASQENND